MSNADALREYYRLTFDTDDGMVVIDDLEARYHIHTPTFSPDPYESAYREGQRSVVLFIKNMLIDPTLFDHLRKEVADE